MSLKHFLERYHEYSFELVDELYGYHTLTYSGYLNLPDDDSLIEMSLEVYYSGELVYDTESETESHAKCMHKEECRRSDRGISWEERPHLVAIGDK